MSFDVLRDGDGDGREQFPLSMLLCAGTQADTAMSNRYTAGGGEKHFSGIHPSWFILTGTAIVCEPNKFQYSADISMYTSVCFCISPNQVKIDTSSLDLPALHVSLAVKFKEKIKIKNEIIHLYNNFYSPSFLGIVTSCDSWSLSVCEPNGFFRTFSGNADNEPRNR